ncbi:MAG: amidohydrolase family protein [Gammaproteobacteria bacterium]|nr:amidohydrolase family protein [Gammaproteobacteria bacterium]
MGKAMSTLAIRNGLVVDGTGGAPGRRDVFVRDGKIASGVDAPERTIDAAGRIVSPGFIDIHTHFDPQLCWDGLATPSLEHGVTTVVIGNCSLSLAPVKPEGTAKLISMFQVIEDIKKPTFDAAVPWCWETFPEYLDFIRGKLGVNVGALIGHSAVRAYVMGAASQERAANAAEIDEMCRIVEEAMAAGALGISSSYLDMDENMRPVPSRYAEIDEKLALAKAMSASGRGVWQVVPYIVDPEQLLDNIRELGDISLAADIPCSLQPVLGSGGRALDDQVRALTEQHERGARVYGQTMPRTFDMNMRLSETSMLLFGYPTWKSIMDLPASERAAEFGDPGKRQALVEEMVPRENSIFGIGHMRVGDVKSKQNEQYQGRTVNEIAEAEGKRIGEVVLDLSLRDDLDTEFKLEGVVNADQDAVARLIDSPLCHFGASDAGAHITQFCGSGDTTYMLSHFVREAGTMPLERAVHRMTGEVARDWGIRDRGTLEEGQAADIVIFDADRVAITKDEFVDDFPGEARRYVRRAEGFDRVLVNGEQVYGTEGYTSARPGRIV